MKMDKPVIFVKKNLKMNMWNTKTYCKLKDHYLYRAKYERAAHSICNLKYSVPKIFL